MIPNPDSLVRLLKLEREIRDAEPPRPRRRRLRMRRRNRRHEAQQPKAEAARYA